MFLTFKFNFKVFKYFDCSYFPCTDYHEHSKLFFLKIYIVRIWPCHVLNFFILYLDIDYAPNLKWLKILNQEVRAAEKENVNERKKERLKALQYLSDIAKNLSGDQKTEGENTLITIKKLFEMEW